jgi:hypothetical protein
MPSRAAAPDVIFVAPTKDSWHHAAAGVTMGVVFARNERTTSQTVVMAITQFAPRSRWFLRALGRNPLVRLSDRLEVLAALAVVAAALLAVPIAAMVKSEVYSATTRTAGEQAQSRHAVEALALESTALLADYDNPGYVRVQWHDGGQLRDEKVTAPAPVKAGEALKIWVDDAGKVVAPPLTVEDAETGGVGAAVTVWVAIVVCGAVVAWVIRRGLDRARDRAWERELRLLAHNDDGWANRHL